METDVDFQVELIEPERYSIDTSVFREIWCSASESIYSKERFPQLWDYINELIQSGRIIISKLVYKELKDHEYPGFQEWLIANEHHFILDQQQLDIAESIINEYYALFPAGYKPEERNGADPFVVAAAVQHKCNVFSMETRIDPNGLKSAKEPHIPNVCDHCGSLLHFNLMEFMDREGLGLALQNK